MSVADIQLEPLDEPCEHGQEESACRWCQADAQDDIITE